ncbi:carbohydrate kinase family protein [Candidatus Pacearchaeota archaeon]|nr:carbohydrate kinase family protein [Candidatus Pacearchaeota archaeon]
MSYDIITIGGMNRDLFVLGKKLEKKHHDHLDICFHEGEKVLVENLFFCTGGGALNTAIAFSRLGLKTASIACLGNDEHAHTILNDLKKENVTFLGKIKNGPTGFSIILTGKEDRTILVHKGINDQLEINDLPEFKTHWIYISTLHGKSFETAQRVAKVAREHHVPVAANLSSYAASLGTHKLSSFLQKISILIINRDEAELISKKRDLNKAAMAILKYLPGILVITDGANPVHAYMGQQHHTQKIKNLHPINATGAGDAFAAGFVYARMIGKDLPTALSYGVKESQSVLSSIGAHTGLLTKLE